MLFTGKGDSGATTLFNKPGKYSKDSVIFKALGSLDELNSFLGLCKSKSYNLYITSKNKSYIIYNIINTIQDTLFTIQAELAGASFKLSNKAVIDIEIIINQIEDDIPAIKSFTIPGGHEIASLLDYGRTITRRTERALIKLEVNNDIRLNIGIKSYINRLSSLLFALARLINYYNHNYRQSPLYLYKEDI